MKTRTVLSLAASIGCLLLLAPALATPVGVLNEANCSGGGVTIDATHITWLPAGTTAGTGCIATGAGTNVVTSSGVLGPGVTGDIKNLTAGGSLPLDAFMSFAATFDFVLTNIEPATTDMGTNCAATTLGQTCTFFAGSPFVLTNLGKNTGLALNVDGTIADATGTSTWNGTFTTQLAQSIAVVQSTIVAGGSITSTQSGSFIVTAGGGSGGPGIPEPASMLLLAGGLLTLARSLRRKPR